ncbi:hypothetical protein LOTGIDRAFT_174991 [Lottia gigantea]|uniref:Ig-like domain-containing protein n=1 Tax=Lottia gigantea TaxID=225164 RepID=V4AMI0_LOTGI|nr:hypothetical protein LOTGIDRAFT_174991 [Lottia gigantea]ESO95970.1 hypothetical protein LOTGIDRAFT_174991 [Lottia gigantea]
MEYKSILIVIVYLSVLITGQYTIRGVPESYAELGENYTLQCTVTDSPSLVDFRRNNIVLCSIFSGVCQSTTPIDNRYKCECINNNKTLYLNISNINIQDDTTWSCRGNSGGQGSTNVSVYYGPENIRYNPNSDNIDVIEGKRQSVNCLADCKPDCNITWSKDDELTFSPDVTSINIIEGRDQTITCLNDSIISDGPDELTFSPDVTSINIIEGGDQTITCLTDCYKCNYNWTGPVSSPTKDLVLTQIKEIRKETIDVKLPILKIPSLKQDLNLYKLMYIGINCFTSVLDPPYITSITSDAVDNETDEGSDVIFNCNVNSKPVSTIT